jgi:oxygen-dependent protoporphyrinogen oxidase
MEAAADNFLIDPPHAVELCRSMGLEDSLIETNPAWRQASVVHRGRLQPIPTGFTLMAPSRIRPMLRSPVLSVRGKLRMALEPLVPRKRSAADESLAAFVRRRFGCEMHDRLVQPLIGGIYAGDAERLSVEATMPRFVEMEREHGSVIRAMLRQRPQVGQNGSGARYGQFVALRDGMSSLVDALARRLPPKSVQLASPVDVILSRPDQRWSLFVGGEYPHHRPADGVILATPAYRSAQLLRDVDATVATLLGRIEYAGSVVISLGYRRDQINHPLNGFGFVVPLIEQRTVLSCSFSSIKYEGRAPDDAVLLRVFMGGACQSGLLRLSGEQLIELAERDIGELLQVQGEPTLRHLTRHHRALPQYHVGHRDRLATINRRLARFPTLALAGSAYGGVGIPACIESGQAAANQILARLDSRCELPKAICAVAEASV